MHFAPLTTTLYSYPSPPLPPEAGSEPRSCMWKDWFDLEHMHASADYERSYLFVYVDFPKDYEDICLLYGFVSYI